MKFDLDMETFLIHPSLITVPIKHANILDTTQLLTSSPLRLFSLPATKETKMIYTIRP